MVRYVSALSFALLLAVLEFGSAMRCYQCNSQSDPACGDPYKPNPQHLVDCNDQRALTYNSQYLSQILPNDLQHGVSGAPRYCHKFVMATGTVVRTCMDANPVTLNSTCQAFDNLSRVIGMADRSKHLMKCSVCDKDSCNGAGSIAASVPLAALALVASYMYYQH